jgi:hypothetical protein
MVADAMLDCSARGDIVLDAFLGSGTTVIAASAPTSLTRMLLAGTPRTAASAALASAPVSPENLNQLV